jgi:hypothetical protein
MEKTIFLLPALVILSNLANAQSAEYKGKLLGKVKSVRLLTYNDGVNNVDEKWPVGDSLICFYGKNRNQQDKGFLYYLDPDGKITEYVIDQFNLTGKVSTQTNYYPDSSAKGKTTYTYGRVRELIKEVSYKSNDIIEQSIVYSYGKGRLTEKKTETQIPGFSRQVIRLTYGYDTKGNKIESDEFWDGEKRETIRFQYDGKQRIIKSIHHFNPAYSTDFEIRYEYDENGNIITESKDQPAGVLLTTATYTYELDSNKNWTEKFRKEIVFKTGNTISYKRFRQRIEYY